MLGTRCRGSQPTCCTWQELVFLGCFWKVFRCFLGGESCWKIFGVFLVGWGEKFLEGFFDGLLMVFECFFGGKFLEGFWSAFWGEFLKFFGLFFVGGASFWKVLGRFFDGFPLWF